MVIIIILFKEKAKKRYINMNKRMVFIVILVITVLLYDLVFHTTCFFPEQCYCLVHLVASVLYSHSYMPFAALQHLVEPFSNSNSGSGPYHSNSFSCLLLSSHCPHSDSICSTLWISCSFLFGNLNNSWQEL